MRHPREGRDYVGRRMSEARQEQMWCNATSEHSATLGALSKWVASLVTAMFFAPLGVLAAPGDLDSSYGISGLLVAPVDQLGLNFSRPSVAAQTNGKRVVANRCFRDSIEGICVYRIDSDGNLDATFGSLGIAFFPSYANGNSATDIVVTSDRALVVATDCGGINGWDFCLIKFSENGLLDASFGSLGVVRVSITPGWHRAAVVREDSSGRLIVAGDCYRLTVPLTVKDFCAARVLPNGALDSSFGNNGVVSGNTRYVHDNKTVDLVVDSDSGIVALTQCWAYQYSIPCLYKFDALGDHDLSFGREGVFEQPMIGGEFFPDAYALTADGLGSYIYATECAVPDGKAFCLVKVSSTGVIDQSYGSDGLARLQMSAFDVRRSARPRKIIVDQIEKKLTVGGMCYVGFDGESYKQGICVGRLLASGIPDESYGNAGRAKRELSMSAVDVTDLFSGDQEKLTVAFGCIWPGFNAYVESFCLARLKGGPYDASTCTLNADLNNQVAGNDGVLAVRYLLGFTGDALADGALGANPGRTAQQIESHLAQLKTDGKLDVDGDGEVNAMTDGLLILRAMLGLSGDALIAGARNASHPNVRDAKQILTWIESTHGVACLP
jgi:uncharacterized delta-60 repeat protein